MEQAAHQQRRRERYDQARTLHAHGLGIREISRRLHLSWVTVRRYLTSATVPVTGPRRRRPSQLDPYRGYILQRWEQECRHARALYRELRAMGYPGGRSRVAEVVTALRRSTGISKEARPAIHPVTARRGFAHRLEQDFQAVYEALRLPSSNGPAEGWIHKLKAIKRTMDGRAGLDLQPHRLLCCT